MKIKRDISWLAFNQRVLQEAQDDDVHIYDRLRFLGIFSNNLDEFYRVRVGTLTKMLTLNKNTAKIHLEDHPELILQSILETTQKLQGQFDRTFAQIIKTLGGQYKVYLRNERQLNPEQKQWVKHYFEEKVRTQIVPLMIESMPKTPMLRDRSIYLACMLGSSLNSMLQRFALIEVPENTLPRFIKLPFSGNETHIILLEDVIRGNLHNLFAPFGFDRFKSYIIKVTRDADMDMDNGFHSDLITELRKNLKKRSTGKATRFVYDKRMDPQLLEYLTRRLDLSKNANLIAGGRIHNFKAFMNFPKEVFSDIIPRPKSFVHPLLKQPCRIMSVIEKRDVLLHFPYHSFDSVIDLLREAAIDPAVQSIHMTVYRLAKDSKVINALLNAVRNGKKVTVILELKARFDEEANLQWKTILEEEGIQVFVGVPEKKVHAKLCLIKKREFNKTISYGFISTGNFHEGTAGLYGDHLLMTTRPNIVQDIQRVFQCLSSPTPDLNLLKECKTLITTPHQMRPFFQAAIKKEIQQKKKGRRMIVKLNSLVDPTMIQEIYKAAKEGVEVDLIVRGIFTADIHQEKFKKPIKAISIVDQYLEHARVFIFNNDGDPKVYISSADWMMRNLNHRVEVACPIFSETFRKELIDIYEIQLRENVKARILDSNQHNRYVKNEDSDQDCRSQIEIYNYLIDKEY
ncbi:MAG: polyphosphate kinase 1 [Bacteroidia bacterium]|nr:polyphosphate kinase 1 [Bacteroidia bacterium]